MATTETTSTTTTSTTPAAPATTILSTVEKDVKADATTALSWLQKHERIIITALVLTAGSWFGDHWLNTTAARDKQQAAIQSQQLDEQKTKDTALAQQVTTLASQYQTVVTQLTQENAQLVTQVKDRVVVLHDQQQTDQSLPLPDLGNRWAQLAQIAPADISASTAGIAVTPTGARDTVSQLEQIPVLQANLKDTQTIADNKQDELTKANALVGSQTAQIAGLNTTITDEETSCKAQIKAVNSKARSKWFKVGLVGGFVVGFVTGHKL